MGTASQTGRTTSDAGDPAPPCLQSPSAASTDQVQAGETNESIPGSVVPSVAGGTALRVGSLPSSMTVNMELVLSIRNLPQFRACLDSIETPGSPNYHHFLNERTLAPYMPSPEDKAFVVAFLMSQGFTVTEGPSPLVIRFAGTVNAAERAFGVELTMFEQNSRRFFATASDPILPVSLAAMTAGIVGLDNNTVARPTETPCGVSSPDCPQGLQVGYNMTGLLSHGFDGSGVTVAVVDAPGDPNPQGAIDTFDAQYGLFPVTLSIFYPDGPPAHYDPGWASETAMDIEAVHSMAPGAGIALLYDQYDLVNAIDYVATNHLASIVSNSWSYAVADSSLPPIFLEVMDFRLMVDAAQGLTILFASGDSGANPGGSLGAEFPASDPNVLSVGATNLGLTGCTGVTCTGYGSEEGANISGGGYSGYFPEPSWQTVALGSLPGRGVPDVSALGYSPGLWVYSTNSNKCGTTGTPTAGWFGCSGTSLSTPLWAGFLAVAFQYEGRSRMGNIDPLIYALGSGASYFSVFHDVVTGSNGYSAGPGWDPVTGWGSPITDRLAHSLATIPAVSLSSSLGGIGASVTVSGFNLLASSSLTVMYDGSTAGMPTTCATDSSGNINPGCIFTVPSSVPGPHTVTVTDGTNGPTAAFTVLELAIFLTPSIGPAGTTVTIAGSGFVGSHSVTATFNGISLSLGGTCVTSWTSFLDGCTFRVPPSPFGTYVVTVSDGTNTPTDLFTVIPSLRCSPDTVYMAPSTYNIGRQRPFTTCTTTVTGNHPTGSVTWSVDGPGYFSGSHFSASSSSCSLVRGRCTVRFTPLSPDLISITARYNGDSSNNPGSATFDLDVSPMLSHTTLVCQRTASPVGFNCLVRVTGYHPSGNVYLLQTGPGLVAFSSFSCRLSVRGVCSVTLSPILAGSDQIVAVYLGDLNNSPSIAYRTVSVRTG